MPQTDNGNGRRLFGTDGMRGKANHFPMTPELALKLGKATAIFFRKKFRNPKIVIGKDTRLSGYMLETALTSGLVSMGANVLLVGPMPTPAISHLTRSLNADAGIMISASHNPAEDNGIKIFDSKGFKLSDEDEKGIEEIIFSEEMSNDELNGASIGKAFRVEDAKGRYIEFAKASIGNESLKGFKIVVDCANGAAYSVAPEIFSELGAETIAINNSPDGLNINKNCGATDISSLSRKVVEAQADMGFALDGDADRLIVVDSKGKEVNGDKILGFIAEHLKSAGMLAKETVVATVMSNSALERHLSGAGIRMLRAPVGDRYVIEEMRKNGYNFGGEQSGHIIFGDYSTTGDGIITALQILKIMKAKNISVPDAFRLFELYPQVLVNVKVREKKPFEEMPRVLGEIDSASAALAGKGRVFVRYSGTENLARVMVEGENEAEIKEIVEKIALRIKEGIGVE